MLLNISILQNRASTHCYHHTLYANATTTINTPTVTLLAEPWQVHNYKIEIDRARIGSALKDDYGVQQSRKKMLLTKSYKSALCGTQMRSYDSRAVLIC